MKRRFAIIGVILWLWTLAGCATSPHPVNLPPPVKTANLASLDFDFILVAATDSPPDLRPETRVLQDSILSGLRETGLFRDVEETNTNGVASGIKILASITQINRVSKKSREWFGGFAGNATAVVHVMVSDLATGNPVEVFDVEGQTGATAWAGLTDAAVQQAAQKVVAEITTLDSQAARQLMQQSE